LSRPAALERRLGHRFSRAALLEQALTHRSHGPGNNERLEFLGDGVLGCAVAEELYARFPQLSEGKLTRLRASLVREETLAEVARGLGLAQHLRRGEVEVGDSMLANALEALIGAMFVDGGYGVARKSVLTLLGPLLERLDPDGPAKDAKTDLQEIVQAQYKRVPEYRVVAKSGAAHQPSFDVECVISELKLSAKGSGTSRRRAEQEAAKAMLEKLGRSR
jgi:ribonuclease-3